MTVTADNKKRVTLVDAKPGQSFDYGRDSAGRIVLRPLRPDPAELESESRVLKLSGKMPRARGVRADREQIARLIREEREAR
jgi:hypothetical protein